MPAAPITVGVIGLGRIGKIHARNLVSAVPGVALRAVYDMVPSVSADAVKELKSVRAFADPDEIFSDDSIRAVVIATPTNTHADLVERAVAHGKDVFCEKPLDLDVARCRRILKGVAERRVSLQLGFQRRFDPQFLNVAAASGKIGKPLLLQITSRDPSPPPISYVKTSGGLFVDMAIHDFDMARFLLKSEPKSVFATGANLLDPEIGKAGDIDTALTSIEFENGALAVIANCRQSAEGYDQRVELFGSSGSARAENVPLHGGPDPFFIERYLAAYVAEMRQFIDCLRTNQPPTVGGFDALQALLMGIAAGKSLAERRPVHISELG